MSAPVSRIEVAFAIPVTMTQEQERRMVDLLSEIVDGNVPAGCVHWVAGIGSKPHFSQADAAFLGQAPDGGAPESGEPTFEDGVFYVESCCREAHPGELERRAARAAKGAPDAP